MDLVSCPDARHISRGLVVPSLHYCDQVYLTKTDDGAWLAVMTTGAGREGERGQHVRSMRSSDAGRTWSDPVNIEPPDGPEASYAVLLKVPSGRVYAFYNYNSEEISSVPREDGGTYSRVDCVGDYVFKFSDDHGRSWSEKRWRVAVRPFACDTSNVTGGRLTFFWNVGRPCVTTGRVYLPHIKVGAMGEGFYAQSEGAVLVSDNILTEPDPDRIVFKTLPEGDCGLTTPEGGGRIAEEQSLVELSDGSLFCVYRTIDGYPVSSYSRERGRTWEAPRYHSYRPDGKRMKHPRAANFVWKCSNGKYLYWFHNHGGSLACRGNWNPYDDRNPVWICAGEEVDSPSGKQLVWSQPEILLYDDDPCIRMSYPDLLEDEGRFYISETQKIVARIHEIPQALVDCLFRGSFSSEICRSELLLESSTPHEAVLPRLPAFYKRDYSRDEQPGVSTREGITLEFIFTYQAANAHEVLLTNLNPQGQGFQIVQRPGGRVEICLSDGRTDSRWSTDVGCCQEERSHHVAFILDAGPRIVSVVVDGALCDGGESRQFGWGRFHPYLTHLNGSPTLASHSSVSLFRLYGRALFHGEVRRNFLAEARTFGRPDAGQESTSY